MAFTNFYLIAGGTGSADINAGSSIGAAQAAATTNGSWSTVTGIFTATGGSPFAATVAGDYASIYVDGATVTTFVAKVLTVTSSVIITVDVATIKYGTAPTTSATGRSCVINGSWNTEQVLAAGGLASFTIPQSTKINVTGTLTIAASRTISMNGAATTPLWLDGYAATPGDLDTDTTNTLAKPIWTLNSTFSLTVSSTNALISNLAVTGVVNGTLMTGSGSGQIWSRTRITNTSANTGARAASMTGGNSGLRYSYLQTPTTATASSVLNTNGGAVVGCVIEGGAVGITASSISVVNCVLLNGVIGAQATTNTVQYYGCTFSNMTTDGIRWTGAAGVGSSVVGCLFRSITGTAINNTSGTNTTNVYRACNDFYSCGTTEAGFGDMPAFFGQTDSSDPVTSASNMTPVAGSNARNNGFPGIFENESFSSYADIGAVRHQDPAGFGGAVFGG